MHDNRFRELNYGEYEYYSRREEARRLAQLQMNAGLFSGPPTNLLIDKEEKQNKKLLLLK